MSLCGTCLGGPDCLPSNDLNLMSLDSTIYPFVPNCPPGRDCYGNMVGNTIYFPVCGQTLSRDVPAGATQQEINQIIGDLLTQAAQLTQFCDGTPPPPPPPNGPPTFLYFNDPQTCTVYCPDGSPFNYTVNAGIVLSFSKASADMQAYAIACQRAKAQKICLNDIPAKVYCGGLPLNLKFIATGSLAPFPIGDLWEMIDGTLPSGVTFPGGYITGGVATLSGIPSSGGTFTFTIRITNPNGSYQQKSYTFTILNINTVSPLPSGTIATPYSQTLTQSGASGTVSWSVASGTLPPGLSLNTDTGAITGTPTTNGIYPFTVQITST